MKSNQKQGGTFDPRVQMHMHDLHRFHHNEVGVNVNRVMMELVRVDEKFVMERHLWKPHFLNLLFSRYVPSHYVLGTLASF